MLEQQNLLLRLWTSSSKAHAGEGRKGADPVGVREIDDLTTGQPLGVACWWFESGRFWLPWLARTVLEVRAAEDESFWFSACRSWGLLVRWKVYDAHGRRVATLRGRSVLDHLGQVLARIERSPKEAVTRFRGQGGHDLATLSHCPDGIRIAFAAGLEGDTLAKMALLAAALAITTR